MSITSGYPKLKRSDRSVSVDDVVILPDGTRHKVLGCGWEAVD